MARRTLRVNFALAVTCVATASCTALLGNDFEIDDGASGSGGASGFAGAGSAGAPVAGSADVGGGGSGGVQGEGGGGTGGGGLVIKRITAGANATCALHVDGRLRCWGAGPELGYGEAIAVGDNESPRSVGDVPAGGVVTNVSVNGLTCAVYVAGAVRCWGRNAFGELGRGDTTPIGDNDVTPSLIGTLSLSGKAEQVATGAAHACALLEGGLVQCWGLGENGRLGYGNEATIGDDEVPAVANLVSLDITGAKATYVDLGDAHSCALLDGGAVRCWGAGGLGQLGNGEKRDVGDIGPPATAIVVPLGIGRRAVQLSVGGAHSCALLDDGTARCWGLNDSGQLGTGKTENLGDDEAPTQEPPIVFLDAEGEVEEAKVAQVEAGAKHTCARLTDGTVRCWGLNDRGQLGYGEAGNKLAPGLALDFGIGNVRALQLAVGAAHACALFEDGGVRCWGEGSDGRLGYGNTATIGDEEPPSVAGRVLVF